MGVIVSLIEIFSAGIKFLVQFAKADGARRTFTLLFANSRRSEFRSNGKLLSSVPQQGIFASRRMSVQLSEVILGPSRILHGELTFSAEIFPSAHPQYNCVTEGDFF